VLRSRQRAQLCIAGELSLCFLAALSLWQGCGHTSMPPTQKLAVLPLDGVGVSKEHVLRLRKTISKELSEAPGTVVIPADQVDQQMPSCGEVPVPKEKWVDCATRVGKKLKASHVVVGAVGGLSDTYVFQLKLVSVSKGAPIRSLEETLFGRGSDRAAAAASVASRLLNIRPTPWYKRWWFWTIVGIGATAVVLLNVTLQDSVVIN
jgi:hypothetical protein